ncbi:hypothetical protein LTR10_016932 [Elasticomyces elasticus]|uniref:MIT domain-containing protein n=1 Tax=Exophiala sideris TaxID=1016849 RepID=A0ABR0JET8_9EURO|nr:hypothetical protein LTR10_016932 [Elasticomyces elasticus]KAK5025186.1 hypothetical protein LTS07_008037 [Exophiala sideris]KAK5029266.1 hypothetical protein LTR13_008803 [Exophiala sideris]KAK5063245.1 hypothetical protein LTR69_003951 [Exophiala sideris]KAK5178961.1 hypothetical protein LTR44_008450 [Eurotiomycetes sp. CCFEE 6388]
MSSAATPAIYNEELSRPNSTLSSRYTVKKSAPLLVRTSKHAHLKRKSKSPDRLPSASISQSPHRARDPARLQVDRKYTSRDVSPGGVSPLTPTSMFNPAASEHFGEWQARKIGKAGEPLTMSVHYMRTTEQGPRPTDNIAPQHISQNMRPSTREGRPESVVPAEPTDSAAASIPGQGRSHRSPAQKTILSKALAKANNAVLLDNAQNIEGAIEAYAEACDLLQQVMVRSSDMDDRKKLSAIKSTYSNRIAELHDLDDTFSGLMEKELPEDPPFDETNQSFFSGDGLEPDTTLILESVQIPPRQESLLPEIFGGETYINNSSNHKRIRVPSLAIPMDTQYMPPPLSPKRPLSAASERDTDTPMAPMRPNDVVNNIINAREEGTTESTSWLDTVEDGEVSSRSSRLSSIDLGIHHTENLVDDIEAEFDAALDAAVDAAYDDDEAPEDSTPKPDKNAQEVFDVNIPAFQSILSGHAPLETDSGLTREYDDGDSTDEEERMLEEMTKGYTFDDFSFDNKSKSALPRQSDSSTFSGQTWASSVPSTIATTITALSTLKESHEPAHEPSPRPTPPAKDLPRTSPPKAALPLPPTLPVPQSGSRPNSFDRYGGLGIRERRFSGRSGEQLRVETFARRNSTTLSAKPFLQPPAASQPSGPSMQNVPRTAPLENTSSSLAGVEPLSMATVPSMESFQTDSPSTPALTQGGSQGSIDESMIPPSPARLGKMVSPQGGIKNNSSSSSLRPRNLSVATIEMSNESPATPISGSLGAEASKVPPPHPLSALPTPSAATFGPNLLQAGGMYLFDDHTGVPGSPKTPRSPSASLEPPQPLEPCPESFFLRPFWLMRCLYQTLAHPRGGYLTTKLFIPRDIWRVRNVKLKALEDKVSQCDLLTAALQKLAKVDTFDADAVLEELQSFEAVLDQVRVTLLKKIGSEVGFGGSSNLFKTNKEEQDPGKTNNTSKGFASSWRKLRSKSSAPAMGNPTVPKDALASGLTIPSLPMTSSSSVQSSRSHHSRKMLPPPTPTAMPNIQTIHATYMASLARLFDAAQVLDAIARQVEDPGLKCSSKTQVGLELGVKNAAEFFAFYIIRFVMADLMLMVDKFLKRGSEWVLT